MGVEGEWEAEVKAEAEGEVGGVPYNHPPPDGRHTF